MLPVGEDVGEGVSGGEANVWGDVAESPSDANGVGDSEKGDQLEWSEVGVKVIKSEPELDVSIRLVVEVEDKQVDDEDSCEVVSIDEDDKVP